MNAKYKLEQSENGKDWVLTDKENLIVISFENKRFNDTQKIVNINDFTPEQIATLPTILREMTDWLTENHPNKV